jgi:hypothetical protein
LSLDRTGRPRETVKRRSYAEIAGLPAWGLYDADGKLVATVRAYDTAEAGDLFRQAGDRG